jgi:hypothetical protein
MRLNWMSAGMRCVPGGQNGRIVPAKEKAARVRGLLAIVIPAKAGIQFFHSTQELDSGLRRNDG